MFGGELCRFSGNLVVKKTAIAVQMVDLLSVCRFVHLYVNEKQEIYI